MASSEASSASKSLANQAGLRLMLGGAVLGNALYLAATPLVAALFSPEAIGRQSALQGWATFVSAGIGLRLEFLIPAAKSATDATKFALAAVTPVKLVGLFSVVLLSVHLLGRLPVGADLAVAGLYIIAIHVGNVSRMLALRDGRPMSVAAAGVLQPAARALLQVVGGLLAPSWVTAALGDALGRLAGVPAQLGVPLRRAIATAWRRSGLALRETARSRGRYVGIGIASSVVDAAAFALLVPIFAHTFGMVEAGKFALAIRLALLPASLLGRVVADVLHTHIGASHLGRHRALLARFTFALAGVSFLGLLVVQAVVPRLEELLLSSAWSGTAGYVLAMAGLGASAFVVSPLARYFYVREFLGAKLLYDGLAAALQLGAVILGGSLGWTPLRTAGVVAAGGAIAYAVMAAIVFKMSQSPPQEG